ncbi:class I SAM-dependent methyltransferase [Chloroflexia bacterium SDU3-3]|nr:class I SAM-dependent methyltransferase [Chloroflexia bacterium SDU3-3]
MTATTTYEKQWWEEGAGFFGRGYMEGDNSVEGYLDAPMTLEERTESEVRGIINLLQLQPGQHVLDCPSGYGRHSIGLGRHGMNVIGADINGEELFVATQKRGDLSNVQFIKNDMRFLYFQNHFDAVINMFYSFGFFDTDEENIQVLRNFYNALKPGGKFLMHTDVNIPRIISGKYKSQERRNLPNGNVLEIIDRYEPTTKRIEGTWTIIRPDNSIQDLTPYSVRVYTNEEFTGWCHEVGFRTVTAYGSWDRTPLTDESEDMMIIAEK